MTQQQKEDYQREQAPSIGQVGAAAHRKLIESRVEFIKELDESGQTEAYREAAQAAGTLGFD